MSQGNASAESVVLPGEAPWRSEGLFSTHYLTQRLAPPDADFQPDAAA